MLMDDFPCKICAQADCTGCVEFNAWLFRHSLPRSTEVDVPVARPPGWVHPEVVTTVIPINKQWKDPIFYKGCSHKDWLKFKDFEGKDISLFLRSSGQDIPDEVDVFIDLTSNDPWTPHIPQVWREYLPEDYTAAEYVVSWKIVDGKAGSGLLVEFAVNLIKGGKTVGFGCVGGHGRTGWLASRIYMALTKATGDEAVNFIRTNYCESAVETDEQLKNLGATVAKPTTFYGGYTW